MARYAIPSDKAFGVSVGDMQALAKRLGPQPRARRRALGDRLVRGAHAGVVRRRAGARHARADGPLVPRLRQLGASATPSASTCSTARRTRGRRSRSGAAGATSSSSAPPSRCSPASPCTTSARRTSRFVDGLPLIERARRRRAQLRQEGRELGAARDRPAQPRAPRRRRRAGPAPRGLVRDAAARWVGKDALKDITPSRPDPAARPTRAPDG